MLIRKYITYVKKTKGKSAALRTAAYWDLKTDPDRCGYLRWRQWFAGRWLWQEFVS